MIGPWVVLLSGMPNSGKSTIAYNMVQRRVRNALVIDGDKHREMQFLGASLGFSKEDIMRNNEHVCKMAAFAQDQGFNVIIAQICPFRDQRRMFQQELSNFFDVLCDCPSADRVGRPNHRDSHLVYEAGGHDLILDTSDVSSIDDCVISVLRLLGVEK